MKKTICISFAVAALAAALAADFNVRDYDAKGDGMADDTAAIQRTIDACVKAGGGRVVVPRGIYMSYTLSLGSNVDFHLEEGAVLRGGPVGEKYPDFAPSTLWRPERSPRFNRKAFLYTAGATNVAITGTGEIDGNADIFHRWSDEKRRFVRISDTNLTGRCVFFVACRNVRVEDVLIRRPTGWATWFLDCDNLKIARLRITCNRNYMNGDGIHLGGCRDVTVTDCNVDSEDDALILRAHQEQMISPRPLERVLVSNCVFRAQRPDGIRLGWSGDAPVKDVLVTHCRITHSGRGIDCRLPGIYRWSNIDPPRGCKLGGFRAYAPEDVHRPDWLSAPEGMLPFSLENIRFEHLDVRAEECPISFQMFEPNPDGPDWEWQKDTSQTPTTPFKNVVFAHCRFYCNALPSFAPPHLMRFDGLVFDDVQFLPWIPEDRMTERVKFVDSFDLSGATCGLGMRPKSNAAVDGKPLTVGGKVYERGIGTRPEGAILFWSDGKVSSFDALVAIDDGAKDAGSGKSYGKPTARFRVWADSKVVFDSGDIKLGQEPVAVHVELSGAREIALETTGGGAWTAFDAANADWLDARFTCSDGAELKLVNDPCLTRQLGILTPQEKEEPQINGADIWGVRPGHPVIFRVATSGVRPMKFSAKGLPDGVTLDDRGVLRGTAPNAPGDYDIEVTAENAKGKAVRTMRLAVGDRLALTPPMGWNSWNTLCYRLTQEKAMAAAKAMDESGLADHGWAYVNLDDWWEMNNSGCKRVEMRKSDFGGREDVIGPARDESGRILPNRSFPDMKGFTDYVHSFGLKAGLYSSPGPLTCGKCEGSYGHELQDAERWAEWGFDYVKYDWCSYGDVFKKETGRSHREKGIYEDVSVREAFVAPYRLMGECLKKLNRDIVYSFCQYGMAHTETWGDKVGGQCWRSWEDLKDSWQWMELAVEGRIGAEHWKYNKPGWWADPDMMIVGQQYSFGSDHPSYLTHNEQYTHVSLWAMLGSPLMIGCDLTNMDDFTKSLLVNDEVIAVSQDRLGKTARRIRHEDAESVWVRPLVNGFTAVALVNRYPFAREIRVPFDEIGESGECWVKDLWMQKCEGKHSGFYVANVPAHATKLVKMRPVDCRKCE